MVSGKSLSLFDGDLGGAVIGRRDCVDHRRCPLSFLQSVSPYISESRQQDTV